MTESFIAWTRSWSGRLLTSDTPIMENTNASPATIIIPGTRKSTADLELTTNSTSSPLVTNQFKEGMVLFREADITTNTQMTIGAFSISAIIGYIPTFLGDVEQ